MRPRESTPEHPVVRPWADLKSVLAPGVALNAERPPEASLADTLAPRRAIAAEVARLALAVVDACDAGAQA